MDHQLEMESVLTKEKADIICEKIVRGLEENKVSGSANIIGYAMKVAWLAGFEEGRKFSLR